MKWLGSIVSVLLLVGVSFAEDVGNLIKQLQSKDAGTRREAAKKLSEMGKDAKEAVPKLTESLKDNDQYVRRFSAIALGNIGEDAKGSIKALESLLGDENDKVVDAAVESLGKMGTSALPTLVKLVEDDKQKKDRRRDVAQMIANMKASDVASQAVPMLIKLLKEKDADIKMEAIQDLARYGAEAKPAVPELAGMLTGGDNNARRAV